MFGRIEAAEFCDVVELIVGVCKKRLCFFYPYRILILGDCEAGFLFENAREVSRAGAGDVREHLQGNFFTKVAGDPVLNGMDLFVGVVPVLQKNAFLLFPAFAPDVDHELFRHLRGKFFAVAFFQEKKCQIDARGDTGAGVDILAFHVELIVQHSGAWVSLLEPFCITPVRGAFFVVQDAGFGEEECTRAYGADHCALLITFRDPFQYGAWELVNPGHAASGDDQQVIRTDLCLRIMRDAG